MKRDIPMPIENRSSNTVMASELLPCPFCAQQDFLIERLDSDASVVICQGLTGPHEACLARGPVGVAQSEGEEQPGRDKAVELWNSRAQQPHPEPIAWMVGTAFWWTKEEAERDAAATGLPIVGLGPMTDSGEVERLSAACTANIRARDEAIAEGRRYMGQASALDTVLREARRCVAESADPETGGPTQREAQVILGKIDAALSASAEPSAPVAKYPNRLCHIDYTAHPYRCGCLRGDEESQRIYDEHCRSAEPEAKS